ncbi:MULTISPECIES: ABC transporter ATP-binding protein [unclassified Nocardiopsis]|uniref:ABC transporter ATP-binding protein n=1 Tax=Nocardiopsis TaxID=2013 RepID=UPI00387ADEA8
MLEITGLRKAYGGHEVLKGVDLSVGPGQVLGLLGSNGAGKTTLISITAGLRSADSGKVFIGEVDALRDRRRAARLIGLAPQELGIYPTLTVRANLGYFARLAGLRGRAAAIRAEEAAGALGLEDRMDETAQRLSGGQKRRLHTAMAILHRPDVLFLDEPTVGADVRSRAEILAIVREMAAQGTAVLYTTHYLTELEDLEADIAVLHEGRIRANAPLEQVLREHAAARVVLVFDGAPPELAGWRVEGDTLVSAHTIEDTAAATADAIGSLDGRGGRLTGVEIRRPNLEAAFLSITGTELDVEEESRDLVS